MTREEAIRVLEAEKKFLFHGSLSDKHYEPAFDMAIEALQAEYEDYEHATLVDIKEPLKVAVVRCKDCKHLEVINTKDTYAICREHDIIFEPFEDSTTTNYCSWGERAEQTDIPTFKESAEAYKKMTGEDMWTPCNKWIGE